MIRASQIINLANRFAKTSQPSQHKQRKKFMVTRKENINFEIKTHKSSSYLKLSCQGSHHSMESSLFYRHFSVLEKEWNIIMSYMLLLLEILSIQAFRPGFSYQSCFADNNTYFENVISAQCKMRKYQIPLLREKELNFISPLQVSFHKKSPSVEWILR